MTRTRSCLLSALALALAPSLTAAQPRIERVNLNARPQSDCAEWGTAGFLEEQPVERIVACIAAGSDPNETFDSGRTVLRHSVSIATEKRPELIDVVEALIAAGADVHHRDPTANGSEPLVAVAVSAALDSRHRAIAERVVDALLEAGADADASVEDNDSSADGITPLMMAAFKDAHRLVEALIRAGADPEATFSGFTPLHAALASRQRPHSVVEALLDAGADTGFRSPDGQLPIHRAARRADGGELISLLAAAGADVNARATEMRETALHIAAGHNSNREVIDALLAAGANTEVRSNAGQTPLHWSVIFARSTTGLEALLAAGADPNVVDVLGLLPIEYAEDNKLIRGTGAYVNLIRARLR